MSDIEALLAELRNLPDAPASSAHELQALLGTVKSAAGRWADVLYAVQESAHGLVGPRAEAALAVAFRRAEESYVELEIALRDLGPGPSR
ncbi:hypothetical protein [Streptomyces qinzhouensis]|uniref:Uncharacterized protein n=1 Tax=Streptomyces qinzhouensis TaxID=2599401 RepID=A0A5B8JFJ9_9ACTN|nr:hypothetical protein [Streptomyces qinzhouensis]QDY80246.1 hypothetical protein FQU76_31240 [Streptomyces qinzhouensis]